MDFCIGTCAKIDQVDLIKQAEDLGVTHFGVGEGPLLFSDPYQQMALASATDVDDQAGHDGDQPADPHRPGHRELRRHPERASPPAAPSSASARPTMRCVPWATGPPRSRNSSHSVEVSRGLLRGERVIHRWLGRGTRDRVPGHQRPLVRHQGRPDLDGRRRPQGPARPPPPSPTPSSTASARNPDMIKLRPPRTRQRRRRRRPARGLGQARLAELVLPTRKRRDLGGRRRQRLRLRPHLSPASPTPGS